MEYLQEGSSRVRDIPVERCTLPEDIGCLPNDFDAAAFHNFPERKGWELRNFQVFRVSDTEKGDFQRHTVQGDHSRRDSPIRELKRFLQGWLFFGLAFAVLRKKGDCLLEFGDLVQKNDSHLLGTENLVEKLREWADWELLEKRDRHSVGMRMIEVALVLNKARKVARCNLSHHNMQEDDTLIPENPDDDDYISDEQALAIMVLGETLSSVHNNIMKELRARQSIPKLTGWLSDENPGWGQPYYPIREMEWRGWCPRNIHLLRRRFGLHATLLLQVYLAHADSVQVLTSNHSGCNKDTCLATPVREGQYVTTHHESICRGGRRRVCERLALGPDMHKISGILDKEEDEVFPLVYLKCQRRNGHLSVVGIEVTDNERAPTYATVSHVWSDGYGNENENTLWACQLEFIGRALESFKDPQDMSDESIPFWMDTLVIPVDTTDDAAKTRKKKAIRQIHSVFKGSEGSIVLDKALVNMSRGGGPCATAVKILASGWLRRLWTLQEAFLSERLMIAFKEEGGFPRTHLKDFDQLRKEVQAQAQEMTSIVAGLINTEMRDSIMRDWKSTEVNGPDHGVLLVADSWRASRWRTTSRAAHETLALATLLDVQVTEQMTELGIRTSAESISEEERDNLMKDFWIALGNTPGVGIPAGIIFLPGRRLRIRGFGWAPATFMTPVQVQYPDPLSLLTQNTAFTPEYGLAFRSAGFLLHIGTLQRREEILSQPLRGHFNFPVDSGFMEWFCVELEYDSKSSRRDYNVYMHDVELRSSQLAIIISRSSPRESPPEVGLIVEIYRQDTGVGHDAQTLYAQILYRVTIRRIPPEDYFETHLASTDGPYGEVLDKNQRWCVDGFQPGRFPHPGYFFGKPGYEIDTCLIGNTRKGESEAKVMGR
ncbi:hypothetical protein F4780DRAFT_599813 [Xylariomycetidae sp. FL0641]|nr:hypothetical protein F4780DRAFT_599813 [Xylariomycetidae sp. FL0641]